MFNEVIRDKISEINYNYNERSDTAQRIPYIPINIPEPFPYAFVQTKNITSHQDKNDFNNSIHSRERRELDNGGLDAIEIVHADYRKPVKFHPSVTPKIQEAEKIHPSFHVTYWMFYPYSQVK